MPKFAVTVADRHSGAERTLILTAASPSDAHTLAATDAAVVVGAVREVHNTAALDGEIDHLHRGDLITQPEDLLTEQLDALVSLQSRMLDIALAQQEDASRTKLIASRTDERIRWMQFVGLWLLLIGPGIALLLSGIDETFPAGFLLILIGGFLLLSVQRRIKPDPA